MCVCVCVRVQCAMIFEQTNRSYHHHSFAFYFQRKQTNGTFSIYSCTPPPPPPKENERTRGGRECELRAAQRRALCMCNNRGCAAHTYTARVRRNSCTRVVDERRGGFLRAAHALAMVCCCTHQVNYDGLKKIIVKKWTSRRKIVCALETHFQSAAII